MDNRVDMTPDGCPVELYARLPAGTTPELIHGAIPPGASILELGAGAGRITHPLLELGHQVVAVDESPNMLAYIEGTETVRSPIEALALERKFDVVLLMSHLIEKPDVALVRSFLRVCRAHIRDDGCLLIQRDPPDRNYLVDPPFRRVVADGCTITMRDVKEDGSGIVRFTLDYEIDGMTWSQDVRNRRVDDACLAHELNLAGFAVDRFVTVNRSWVLARSVATSPP